MHIRTPFLQIQKTETETLTRLHPSLIQLIASLDNRKQLSYSIHSRQTTYGKTLNSSFSILQGGYRQAGIALFDCRGQYYEMTAVLW